MADASTIRELFVSVGYKIDESGQARAQQGIQQTSGFVERLKAAFNQLAGAGSEAQKSISGIAAPAQGALNKVTQETNTAGNTIKGKFGEVSQAIGNVVRQMAGGAVGGTGGAGGGVSSLLQAVGGVGKAFGVIGAGALAASVTAIYALERIGASLDELGKQAQGTGLAAKTIWEMGDATAKAAGDLESLFRRQPGMRSQFMNEISGYINQVKREMPDADEAVQNHIASLRALGNMAPEVAAQMGQMWYGWSEQETRRRIANADREVENIQRRTATLRAAGMAQEDVNRLTHEGGELSDEFAQAWQGIKAALAQVFAALGPPLITIMKAVNALIKVLLVVTSPLIEIGRLIGVILSPINALFDSVNRGTGIFGALADAVKFVFSPITILADLLQALFKSVADVWRSLSDLNPFRLLGRALGTIRDAFAAITSPINLVKGAFDALVGVWNIAKKAAEALLVPLRPLIWLWEKFQRGRGREEQEAEAPPDQPQTLSARQQRREARREARETRREARRGRGADEALAPAPSFQQGGIVNANLHQGEMVLPARLSQGLQQAIGAMQSAGPAAGAVAQKTREVNAQLAAWLAGASRGPKVVIENVADFARQFALAVARGQTRAGRRQLEREAAGEGEAATGEQRQEQRQERREQRAEQRQVQREDRAEQRQVQREQRSEAYERFRAQWKGARDGGAAGGAAVGGGAAGGGAAAAAAAAGPTFGEGAEQVTGDWRTAPRDQGPAGEGPELVTRAPGTGTIERRGAEGAEPMTPGGRAGRAVGDAVARAGEAIGEAVGGGAPAMARGVVGPNASTNERMANMMTRFQDELGLTKEQAAGIVGNFAAESGNFKQMQERKPISGRGGLGYGQWTGSRREEFERFLKEKGTNAYDHDANVEFAIRDFKSHMGGKTLAHLKQQTDVESATRSVHTQYERPADTMAEPGQRFHGARVGGRVIQPWESSPKRLAGAQAAMAASEQVIPPRSTPETGAPPGAEPQREMGERPRTPAAAAGPGVNKVSHRTPTTIKGVDQDLVKAMTAGYNSALPEGYTAKITSGAQGRTDPRSQHGGGNALDFQIFKPDGTMVPNRGDDTTGLYKKAFVHGLGNMMVDNPDKAKKMRYGGMFGVNVGGGGVADLMHVDLGDPRVRGVGRLAKKGEWEAIQSDAAAHAKSLKDTKIAKAERGGIIPDNPLGGLLGNIMPLLAHAGEMVLPRELSQGLQAMIGGGGFSQFDRPLGGDTFQNYNQRQVTINQTNNHTWSNPGAMMQGRMRDVHDRITGDLVRHFTSAMA